MRPAVEGSRLNGGNPGVVISDGLEEGARSTFELAGATPALATSRIAIFDDEAANVTALSRLLTRAGYRDIVSSTDSRKAAAICSITPPDIVLVDFNMPHLDGVELIIGLKSALPADEYLPIVMLTGDTATATRQRALRAGAVDFLTKPFDSVEVLLRIKNHLAVRSLHVNMEMQVRVRTAESELANRETLERLAQAAEFRDDETGQHTRRVGELAGAIASQLGMESARVELIGRAAPLHDVGKIAIPDAILLKEGRLTPEEMAVMRTHTTIGARLLSRGGSELVRLAERIALTHHERWDGAGYPSGLKGAATPIEGQVVAVADFYDALTKDRRYRKAWPVQKVLAEIARESGRHFNPEVAAAFARVQFV